MILISARAIARPLTLPFPMCRRGSCTRPAGGAWHGPVVEPGGITLAKLLKRGPMLQADASGCDGF